MTDPAPDPAPDPATAPALDPDFAAGAVAHMNEDHVDAMHAWIAAGLAVRDDGRVATSDRADGGTDEPRRGDEPNDDSGDPDGARDAPDGTSVRMLSIDANEIALESVDPRGDRRRYRLALDPPLSGPGRARARLVELTREARAILVERDAGAGAGPGRT